MSTHLNVTSNLYGLSNALGLEKQAARLLRNSIKHFNPSVDTLSSMRKIVDKAPRARGRALSPTKMVDYITHNNSQLPGFSGSAGNGQPASEVFAALSRNKAEGAATRAWDAWRRYSDRIRSGEVDALNPATLKRMKQLQNRHTSLSDAVQGMGDQLESLREVNPFRYYD